jgi:serine/threonine protein kinase/tetratricopeptide (TPR) repeat protein
MTDQPSSEKSIFLTAIDKNSPEERIAYLDRACAGDARVRAAVEALLAAHDRLETASPPAEPAGERAGARVGPYKLLQQIGEGGMGVVFMAEQEEPVRRQVALKIIKPGMDSRQVVARFEAERQALALMDHPNIAKVLDGGATDSGRPYFVMELVKGVPLSRYCDERRLTPRQRLELFVPVCQAVQHAHQKGIIHRDLKPSNVLVALYDGTPVPKVIDFGVAKATGARLTERSLFTEFGAVVGTLEYMSPEQAELNQLDIDTRSDIYSLGVLLYELLTGTTPLTKQRLKQTPFPELLRLIREEEPPRPSTRLSATAELAGIAADRGLEPKRLCGLVRGELDWIVMKCLEKDRGRRYETASGLARDVERYLRDEPVLACPPSAAYRLRKFCWRNRRALTTLALLGVMLLVALGAVAGSVGWVLRDREAREAKAAAEAQAALDRAGYLQGQSKRAEALAAFERAEVLAGEAAADAGLHERLAAVKERLDAEGRDQEFVGRFLEVRLQDQTRVNQARSTFTEESGLPKIRDALGRFGIVIGDTSPADAVAQIQCRPKAIQEHVLAALHECLTFTPKEDTRAAPWLMAVLNAADADPWRVQVRHTWAAKDQPKLRQLAGAADFPKQPPNFLLWLGRRIPRTTDGARLDLFRRMQRAHPADFWANEVLGWELYKAGKQAEAVRYYTAALALRPHNPGVLVNRGNALHEAGDLEAARADFEEAIAHAPRYAVAHNGLGMVLATKRDRKKAEAAYRQALALDPNLAVAHANLGNIYVSRSDWKGAITCYRRALDIDPNFANAHYNLGYALGQTGETKEAIREYRSAVKLDPSLAKAHYELGRALEKQGNLTEAFRWFQKATTADPNYALAQHAVGFYLQAQDKWPEAIAAFAAAVRAAPKDYRVQRELSWILTACPEPRLRDPRRAVEAANQVIELGQPALGWFLRGCAQYRLGYWKDSVEALEKALALGKEDSYFHGFFLAMAYQKTGNLGAARKRYDQAVQMYDQVVQSLGKDRPLGALPRNLRREAATVLGIDDGGKQETK